MKNKIFAFILATLLLAGCQGSDDVRTRNKDDGKATPVMELRLNVVVADGAGDTRATGYDWQDGDVVLLHFNGTTGRAVYHAATATWELSTTMTLADSDDGQCQTAFLPGQGATMTGSIALTQQQRVYTDAAAAYVKADGVLTVTSVLTPLVGRIRFKGTPGQTFTVSGLSFYQSFQLSSFQFAASATKFSGAVGDDGYSPYFYAFFTDDSRRLVFTLDATSGLARSFGTGVLQQGQSGYVTLPTQESHEGWTLVSLANGGEITFPTVSATTATSVGSKSATLSATVSSAGNGRLKASGFVIATHATPTLADRVVSCGTAMQLQQRVQDLQPLTTYYVRAFATNEAGTTYGPELSFTTEEKDDSPLQRDDFPGDENWNDNSGTDGDMTHDGYGSDEDWNDASTSEGNMKRDDFGADEDWN